MRVQLQYLVFRPPAGGVEHYFLELSRHLATRGDAIEVFCARLQDEEPLRERLEHIDIYRYPRQRFSLWGTLLRPYAEIEAVARAWKEYFPEFPDVVISRHPYFASATVSFMPPDKVVYVPPDIKPKRMLIQAAGQSVKEKCFCRLHVPQIISIEKRLFRTGCRIVTLSQNMRRQLEGYYGTAAATVEVIPPGVDTAAFTPGKPDAGLLKQLDIPPDAAIIVSAGRLAPEKNFKTLIQAVAGLHDPLLYLIILGEGDGKTELVESARKVGFSEHLRLPGLQTDMPRWYRLGDLFALLSTDEPFGHVYLEAMACGIPCIASRPVKGTDVASTEIIEDGKDGLLADPFDSDDIARKITLLLRDTSMRKAMSREARSTVAQKFSWKRHVEALVPADSA